MYKKGWSLIQRLQKRGFQPTRFLPRITQISTDKIRVKLPFSICKDRFLALSQFDQQIMDVVPDQRDAIKGNKGFLKRVIHRLFGVFTAPKDLTNSYIYY